MSGAATMLGHQEAQARFAPMVDRELAPGEEQALLGHLSSCTDCQHGFERYAHAVDLVRSVERERAPADFAYQVLKRARKRRHRIFGWQGGSLLEQNLSVQVAVAVVLAVVVAGLLYVAFL